MKTKIALGLVFVLVVLGLVVPLPLVVLAPGGAVSVGERVEVGRPTDPLSGELLLTTVSIFQPSAFGVVRAWLGERHEVLPRSLVYPDGVDQEEFGETQRQLFRESSEVAAAVGLRVAGEQVTISGEGARIAQVVAGSPADERLRAGDVVVGVDGRPIELASDLVTALATRSAGDEVVLSVRRGELDQEIPVRLREVEGIDQPALGVAVATVDLDITLPFTIEVDQGRIGGPSAGLMIALTVYDLVDPVDLTAGRTIAGTGTIDLDGDVGSVGGVDAKVVAAREAGASLFLVPEGEAALAREAAGDDLEVVPVGSIDDAIAALQPAA
ncbi:MAG TPA: PDZ domain-containing protein [Acidimicrobiales bacterium]|nr:PDZ domain-containing protein [Acidimicrobiales bacterium]